MNVSRWTRSSLLALALVIVWPASAAAQGDRPLTAFWYCYSQPNQDPVYVSAVWDAREIPDEITANFHKYLVAKHNYRGNVGNVNCAGASKAYAVNTMAKTESDFKAQQAGWQKSGMKIVPTGWTGAAAPVGPAPVQWASCSAAVVAAGGQVGRGPYETYVSAPFDAGTALTPALQESFKSFLKTKYGITTTDLNPYCEFAENEVRALAAIKIRSDRGKATGKLIDTAWKFAK